MRKILILLLIITYPYYLVQSQNTTNSPTSKFGIGEIAFGEGGQYAGMGGVGIALRNPSFINYANPASITALDSLHFIVDMGVKGAYRIYSQSGKTTNSFVGNLNNFNIGLRLKPYLYANFFLSPVTSCGYAITLNNQITGTSNGTESSLFEGDGGLSKTGFNMAVLLMKNLSLGASVSYIAGTFTQSEIQSTASEEITSRKRTFGFDFGAQYYMDIDKHRTLTLGAVYGPYSKLRQRNTLTTTSSSSGTPISEEGPHAIEYLPAYYGVGAAYTVNRWMFSADYRFYDWSKMVSNVSYVKYRNQNYLSLGSQYVMGNIYKNPLKLMLGTGISNSYVVINGKKAEDYYVSTGFNKTFRGGNNLTFGVKYSDQINLPVRMQHDRSLSMFLNITFCERIWHSKIY